VAKEKPTLAKFDPHRLQKLVECGINEDEHEFYIREGPGTLADVMVKNCGMPDATATEFAGGLIDIHAHLVAYLLNHAPKIVAIVEAFKDVMDGTKEHEIRENTGLPEERCKEIYKLMSELF